MQKLAIPGLEEAILHWSDKIQLTKSLLYVLEHTSHAGNISHA